MKRMIIIILCLVWWSSTTSAQCYKQLIDASGITLESADIKALQDSACALRNVLPAALRDSFSVIDLGFYALSDDTEGGIAEFTRMAEDALRTMPNAKYYLLFGRQSDSKNGPNSKIFIKLKLPTWGNFKCMTEMEKSLFQIRLENEAKKTDIVMPDTYVRIERNVMFKMKTMVLKVVDCCYDGRIDCVKDCYKSEDILAFFQLLNFIKFDITLNPQNKITNLDCLAAKSTQPNRSSFIENDANYPIYFKGVSYKINELIEKKLLNPPTDFKVYIMDCSNIKDKSFFKAANDLVAKKKGIIYFVYNYSNENYLFVSPTTFELALLQETGVYEEIGKDLQSTDACEDCPGWVKEIMNKNYKNDMAAEYSAAFATVAIPMAPAAAIDGPLPIADAIIVAVAAAYVNDKITFLTYKLYDAPSNTYYAGRTQGFGTPDQIMRRRIDYNHNHVTSGVTKADVDRTVQGFPLGYIITRGREQQLCDSFGGALSDANTLSVINVACPKKSNVTAIDCENRIRPVAKYNTNGYAYHWCSTIAFTEIHPYTGCGADEAATAWEAAKKKGNKWYSELEKYLGH